MVSVDERSDVDHISEAPVRPDAGIDDADRDTRPAQRIELRDPELLVPPVERPDRVQYGTVVHRAVDRIANHHTPMARGR